MLNNFSKWRAQNLFWGGGGGEVGGGGLLAIFRKKNFKKAKIDVFSTFVILAPMAPSENFKSLSAKNLYKIFIPRGDFTF